MTYSMVREGFSTYRTCGQRGNQQNTTYCLFGRLEDVEKDFHED